MGFSVTILGSGAALPTATRNPTSQYIQCNDRHILIDCGEGTQMQLRKSKVHIQKITHILISHLHGDHFFGLVGLLSTLHLLGRDRGLTIYGPVELEQIIRLQLEVGGTKLGFSLDFIPLHGKENKLLFEDKLIEIHTFPLKHRIPCNGFLIQEKPKERSLNGELFKEKGLSLTLIPHLKQGKDIQLEDGTWIYADDFTFPPPKSKAYAYCSDTLFDTTLVNYIQGVDLLYHEATFLESKSDRAKQTYHSTAKQAATIAQLADVNRLIIGHLSARYDSGDEHLAEAQTIFPNTEMAEDGLVFEV